METNKIADLIKLNVNENTEKKNNLTYLSWAWAWTEILKQDPEASYEVLMFDNKPYVFDENLGYMVFTKVTAFGDTKTMQLPVMDGANKAQKNVEYTYQVKDYTTGGMKEKTVAPATMFDINTAIMRCMTKNLALFGLGLYIYAGEDLPEGEESTEPKLPTNGRRI
jgi:hypothetical protein